MYNQQQIILKKVSELRPDPNQPRKEFDDEKLEAIGRSYQQHGMINPIEVDSTGMIVTGESRWRACKLAGIEEIPTILFDRSIERMAVLARQCAENMARKSMKIKEQVEAFRKIYESEWFKQKSSETSFRTAKGGPRSSEYNKGLSLMADLLGVTHTWVNQLYRFAYKTQRPIVDMVYEGKLAATAVQEIEKVQKKDLELPIAEKVCDDEMTVHSVRSMVDAINKHPEKEQEIMDAVYPKKHSDMLDKLGEIIKPPPEQRDEEDDDIDAARIFSKIAGLLARLRSKGRNIPSEKRAVVRDLITELISELTKFRDTIDIEIDGEIIEDTKLLN